jgi:hypothetical protein
VTGGDLDNVALEIDEDLLWYCVCLRINQNNKKMNNYINKYQKIS